jgi:SAM-dependent methyltransferase
VDDAEPYEPESYEPAEYWEHRAPELIEKYKHPKQWSALGWMRAGVEERIVPGLLVETRCGSALIVGAGSGRQYGYLAPLGLALHGFDLAPTMVATCRARYPEIDTTTDSIVGAESRQRPADAVLSSAVLQHVPPADIAQAIGAVQALARKAVVIRECVRLASPSDYTFAHDYERLMAGWRRIHATVTDDTDAFTVMLQAWVPAAAPVSVESL